MFRFTVEAAISEWRGAVGRADWVSQLDGFTLLFEALVLTLAQQMPFARPWRASLICRGTGCMLSV
jgi:transposase